MVECKLKLSKLSSESKETMSEGIVDIATARFTGYDEERGVEWQVTLKTRSEHMPAIYEQAIGDAIGNEVLVAMNPKTQQSKLKE